LELPIGHANPIFMTAHDLPDGQTKHRLSVEEYLLLDKEGAFGSRSTELIGGEVYYMSPKHRPHALAMTEMVVALVQALRPSDSPLRVLTDISVRISDHEVREPDIVITDAAKGAGILPLEAAKLVIEIADTTLATDLGAKADLCAEAGIPEYWVIDLIENRILLHANPRPGGGGYDGQLDVPFGEVLHSATIEGLTVETAGLG
jgi:Uma2 family endonuclease